MLNDSGRQVLRPVAFLLTDGQPADESGRLSDNWKCTYASLVDRSYRRHPNVVPFGYGGATADLLNEISTIPGIAFLAKDRWHRRRAPEDHRGSSEYAGRLSSGTSVEASDGGRRFIRISPENVSELGLMSAAIDDRPACFLKTASWIQRPAARE